MTEGSAASREEESRQASRESPARLMHEAMSLAIALTAALMLSVMERHGYLPGPGYLSSLVLLILSGWHRNRFETRIRFFPAGRSSATFSVSFALGLVAVLLFSVWTPLRPGVASQSTAPQLLHLLVLVPLSEEFYFRGLLLEHLRKSFTSACAVVLCSLLFALLHLPASGGVVAAVLSLLTCILVLKSGALAYAFQLHVAWNGFVGINDPGRSSWQWTWAISASFVIVVIAMACLRAPRACKQ